MKKRIFITGARGFIGKNIVEYLSGKDSYILFFPYHNELELLDTEAVSDFILKNKIDIIIHAASVGGTRKTAYDSGKTDIVSRNLRMFFNLSKHIDSVEKFILLGSGAEYSIKHYQPKMKEDYFGTFIPLDDYGFSKYVCSKYIEKSNKMINLRLFGVFGKHEDYQYRFISNSIVKNILGLPIVINQNVFFDFLYIDDLVKIVEYFINNNARHKFYNACTGSSIDLKTIAGKINEISGRPSDIIVNNPGLNVEYSGDNARLLTELKGYNFTPLEDALKELYGWYKDNLDKIDKKAIEKDEYIKYCRVKK